jgi:hypothetical protein
MEKRAGESPLIDWPAVAVRAKSECLRILPRKISVHMGPSSPSLLQNRLDLLIRRAGVGLGGNFEPGRPVGNIERERRASPPQFRPQKDASGPQRHGDG